MIDPRLAAIAAHQPYPLLFATVSGAHLYGFPSPDSDYDLRGVHILPLTELVGLDTGPETIQSADTSSGLDLDLVTHEVKKFCGLLLKKNGYVLEQLHSPLVVYTTPEHAALCAIARQCVTRHHSHHYLGFAAMQWRMFERDEPPRVKPLLYVYRVLLTGIHLMQTGEVEANLVRLNETFRLPYLPDLISRKLAGHEHGVLDGVDRAFHTDEYLRLRALLEAAHLASRLPERPAGQTALHNLLIQIRLS